MATLAERLKAVRTQRFVGRGTETACFDALVDSQSQQVLLYVHGPGGVGKSNWLAHCERRIAERDEYFVRLDARNIPADPQQIMGAFQAACESVSTPAKLRVLFIDTFEFWQSMEGWVRDQFLPTLPEQLRIVICSRRPPSSEWRFEAGWNELMQICPMGNFSRDEARHYLQTRGIDESRIDDAVRFSHCNPLALAMAADVLEHNGQADLVHGVDREVTRELVRRLTEAGGLPGQECVLQLSAMAMEVNEALIEEVLPDVDAAKLYQWMSQLSCMQLGQIGLYPHDLVREALMMEIHDRFPGRYEEASRRIFDYEVGKVLQHPERGWQFAAQASMRAFFAFRQVPALEGFLAVNTGGDMYMDAATTADIPVIEAAIERHEGQQSLDLFRYWFERQPTGLVVMRQADRRVQGFCYSLNVEAVSSEERQHDTVLDTLWNSVNAAQTVDPAKPFRNCRIWMDCEQYQAPSPVAMAVLNYCFAYVMISPDLQVMSFTAESNTDYWKRFAELVNIDAPLNARAQLGDHEYHTFISDWRRESRADWLRRFSRRVTRSSTEDMPFTETMVLSEADLAGTDLPPVQDQTVAARAVTAMSDSDLQQAVKQALQHFHETDSLLASPLLNSAVVAGSDFSGAQAVRESLKAANDALARNPKTERIARVIHRSYIEPARSQQLAAEALGMSYSTYRRQLSRARDLLAAEFCQMEHDAHV